MARASIVFCLFALTGLAGCAEPPVPSSVERLALNRDDPTSSGLTIQFTARVIDDRGERDCRRRDHLVVLLYGGRDGVLPQGS